VPAVLACAGMTCASPLQHPSGPADRTGPTRARGQNRPGSRCGLHTDLSVLEPMELVGNSRLVVSGDTGFAQLAADARSAGRG
jgi:hypothetical protein